MGKYCFIFLLLFVGFNISAQIVIQADDRPTPENNPAYFRAALQPGNLPRIDKAENGMWDLTGSLYSDNIGQVVFKKDSIQEIPVANLSSEVINEFSGVELKGKVFYEHNSTGLAEVGTYFQQAGIRIVQTGIPTDSLIIPEQTNSYRETVYWTPMAYQSSRKDSFVQSTFFNISVALLGLNKAKGEVRTRTKVESEIAGWGKVRLPNFKDGGFVEYSCLFRKIERESKDSFFINDAPAPPLLLNIFGVNQGAERKNSSVRFEVPGFPLFAAEVDFDPEDRELINRAVVNSLSGFVDDISATSEPANGSVFVYPNPGNNHFIFSLGDVVVSAVNVSVFDISGKLVESHQNVAVNNNYFELYTRLPKGMYKYHITSTEGQRVSLSGTIVNLQ